MSSFSPSFPPTFPPPFLPAVVPGADVTAHRYVHVIGASVHFAEENDLGDEHAHFIGVLDGVGLWAVDVPAGQDPSDGAALDLFTLSVRAPEAEWVAAGRAVQIAEWARTHRFCGRCGSRTEPVPNERAMRCPECRLLAFPRVAPAMITLVTKGDPGPDQQVLLAHGVQFPMPMYSCLAGFVEPGETLEGAVVREVMEEVGVLVGNVTYRSSQPWPFPHSLMIGFRADWQAGDILCDPTEIVDAGWYTRDALPNTPPGVSIARRLIDEWIAEV
ncbi:MAG TPA: NAD(+) diphosphatase [Microthrixaceae bacterium]|jgi:NAD+ diphosphatase|nr:NAD(+) diphosphatase [Microthrixaceae bacterium]